jgi:hypothetical protein
MQRTLLIALAAAVVAAGIAAAATIVLTGDDDVNVASPLPTAVTTAEATADVETASPDPDASPGATDDATDAPDPGADPTAAPGVKIRAAKDVDCRKEPEFCSSGDSIMVADDTLTKEPLEGDDRTSKSRPTIKMDSVVWDPDKEEAGNGDEIGSIHVEVTVSNASQDTFVFAKREIVLDLYRNGKLYDSFATKGDGFEMTPGSKMNGTFDRPITEDGEYAWQAKVWYYEKP